MLKRDACQIGKTALGLLTPGVCGRVLAGFSNAAYFATEQSELFWLASENAPMHLRGLRIAGDFPKLMAGAHFLVEGKCIKIFPDLKADFGDASTWEGSTVPAEAALEIDQIPMRVKRIFQKPLDLSQASGFGRMIPRILSLAASQLDDEAEIDPVLALAWLGIHKIAKACLMRNMSGLLKHANALVGLGGGLTPSGDDFLGGLLFCFNTLQRLYPGFIFLDASEKALFLDSAKHRTHLISFTLLKDLSNGQAVEPLHEWIHSILCDQPPESIRPASRLTQMGHSTGWDLVTGALTGLLLTFRSPDSIDSSAISPKQAIYV
jgi:hypothetical protein